MTWSRGGSVVCVMVQMWFKCVLSSVVGLDGAKYWFSCDSVVCMAWFRCGSDVVSHAAPGCHTDQFWLRMGGPSGGMICYGSASDGLLV